MNPFCPNCPTHPLLQTRLRTRTDKTLKRKLASPVWYCPSCKKTWKKGNEVISKKE